MNHQEKQLKLVEAVCRQLISRIEENSPVTVAFRPFRCSFEVCGTDNLGVVTLQFRSPGQLSLQLGVLRAGTDRLYSNFLPSASEKKALAYLQNPVTHREWLELIGHLSAKVDGYWD